MPYVAKKKRPKNSLARFGPSSPFDRHQMALALRSDPWGKRYSDPFSNTVRSQYRLFAQGWRGMGGMGGMLGAGLYVNPYQRAYGARGFGGPRTHRFGRSAYSGGYYGGYGRRPYSSLSPLGVRANPYRALHSRYPSRSPFGNGRGYGRLASRYRPSYRDYSSFLNRPRPYQPHSYYDEDDYMSEDDDHDSDMDDTYYSSPYNTYNTYNRRYRDYTDWDDDDDELFDEDEFGDHDDDCDSDFDDDGYDTDSYWYDRYAYGGHEDYGYSRRGYRY